MNDFLVGVEEKYPQALLKGRKLVEGNVIACIYKDLLSLDEVKLVADDFITVDGLFYFNLAKLIRELGFSVIDEVTILSNIGEHSIETFEELGGWNSIDSMIQAMNLNNFEKYFDVLIRENIILGLHNEGFNLLKPIQENGKDIIPIKLFRKMDSEGVLDWYESRLTGFNSGSSSKVLEESVDMEITDGFIDGIFEGEDGFVPFSDLFEDIEGEMAMGLPYTSSHMMGLLHGTSNFLAGHSSTGKSTLLCTITLGLVAQGEKVILMTNEQKIKAFKIQFLTLILAKRFKYFKLTKKKLNAGKDNLTEEDKEMLYKAKDYWNEHFKGKIACVSISDSDVKIARKKIREYHLKRGFTTFIYDTFKLEFSDGSNDNHWISLIKDSRTFDKIAKKYNMIGICSMQLALNSLGTLFLDARCLSNSKAVKEILETLIMIRSVYPEELDKENKKFYCRPFQRKQVNGRWIEENYEPDKNATYKMLFFDKTRNAENSTDSGLALLLKFNGAVGVFKEVAYCRPRHGIIQ